jgi:hypothetical protein
MLKRIGRLPLGRVFVCVLFHYLNRHCPLYEIVKNYGHCNTVDFAGLIRQKKQILIADRGGHFGGFTLVFAFVLHDHIKVGFYLYGAVA